MKSNETNGGHSAVLSTAELGAVVDAGKLVELLLDQHWHNGCEIIDGYMPPYPSPETRPRVVVRCAPMGAFLRHSNGPKQGFFWDVYGDDMQTVELAVVALANAPAPRDCSPITFTIPLKAPNDGLGNQREMNDARGKGICV